MGALFGFSGPRDERLLARMGEVLAHRGRGYVKSQGSEWASLAVRPVMPDMAPRLKSGGLLSSGGITLAMSGYLTSSDTRCRTLSDVLERYRVRGNDFLGELRGAFVFALSDGPKLLLARDGAGVRTVYWGRHEGRLLFAVEPKGVLAAPGFPRRLRPSALAQYLTFSFVPGADTMLEGLYELPAGHRLEFFSDREPRLERFFEFEADENGSAGDEQGSLTSEDEWVERFRALHARAVAERLPAGEPVGIFLSGGLDSSVVTAEVSAQHAGPIRTYAIHFGEKYPNELSFARAVAERCGTEHQEVLLEPRDFLPRLRRIVWHLDDPIGDPITVPNFELAAHVSRDVRWVYNGEGGDPCFGGPKNIPMLLHHWYGGIERDRGFRARMYLASYRRSYEELPRLLTPAWANQIDAARDLEGVVSPYFESALPRTFLNKLCAMNIRLKGAHLILPKVDRMAGASRLVTLSPLFDERLVKLSFRMPPGLKLSAGIEKVVLKRAYAGRLPPEVIARPKSGMRVPVHFWFQGEMKRYARSLLAPSEIRRAGIFDPERVKRLVAYDTAEGPGRYGLRLWMLVTFEIWRRLVIEREPV